MANTKRKQTIQSKIKEIEEIVKYFEGEDIDLDASIEKYEEATKLVEDLKEVLRGYEVKIELASKTNQSSNE